MGVVDWGSPSDEWAPFGKTVSMGDAGGGDDELLLVDRLSRLATVTAELGAASDIDDIVRVAMETLDAPHGAPSRALWLQMDPADGHLVLAGQHGLRDRSLDDFARVDLQSDLPGAIAFRERRTLHSSSPADTAKRYPELTEVDRSAAGWVVIPLVVEREAFGVLVFGSDEDLTEIELAFLETVAGQLAQAVSRIRLADALEARARQAVRDAERERRRRVQLEFLAELTVTAIQARDHRELLRAVTARAVPTLGDWCSIHFVPEEGPIEVVVGHTDPQRVAWANELGHRHPLDLDATSGVGAVIRTGRAELIAEIDDAFVEDAIARSSIDEDEARAILGDLRLTSMITVPLLTRRGVIGAMQFANSESGRLYDEDDLALAEAVAGRVAETLTAHWLTDQHRLISETLQRSLLPPVLATVPGFDIAVRYWPAGAVSEVGGDFYDVFALEDRSWAVVIGDACGTGPNAAALTSIARHTVRAAARHRASHPEVVDWLNQAVLLSDRNLFCTACYATLEPGPDADSWTLRTTAAGHPLPVHRPHGQPSRGLGSPGTLLGMFEEVKSHTASAVLGVGDVVVFYTDGVTDLPPPADLTEAALNQLVDAIPDGWSAGEIAEAIHRDVVERVPDTQRRDDIALVILRVIGPPS
jgi:serine phosphatase RsbU (regulator of sigma subunit)